VLPSSVGWLQCWVAAVLCCHGVAAVTAVLQIVAVHGCLIELQLSCSANLLACLPCFAPPSPAEASRRGDDAHTEPLQERVRAALGLPADHQVRWVDLHDAMTTMLTHGKEVPPGGLCIVLVFGMGLFWLPPGQASACLPGC
jgi:hypothetical protein